MCVRGSLSLSVWLCACVHTRVCARVFTPLCMPTCVYLSAKPAESPANTNIRMHTTLPPRFCFALAAETTSAEVATTETTAAATAEPTTTGVCFFSLLASLLDVYCVGAQSLAVKSPR